MINHPRFPEFLKEELNTTAAAYADKTMPVYAEAERLRRRWQAANIALEEYVEELIRLGNMHRVCFELDPAQAADALRGSASATGGAGRIAATTHYCSSAV